jgi:hypothetical protein
VRIISSIPTEAGKRHFNGLELSAQRLAFELVARGNPVDKPSVAPFPVADAQRLDGVRDGLLEMKEITPRSAIVLLTVLKDGLLEEEAYEAGVSWVLSKSAEDMRKLMDYAGMLLSLDGPANAAASGYSLCRWRLEG